MNSPGHPYQLRSSHLPLDPAEPLDRARLRRTLRDMLNTNSMASATQTSDTVSDITRAMRYLHTTPTGAPSHFNGISDNITDWLDDFDLYLSLLRVTSDDEKLPLLVTFLTGTAKLWFKALPTATRSSYADLRQAMTTKFARTPFQINTQRSFIYKLRQEPGELFPDFVLRVQKAARGLNIQQSDVVAICLQGADSRIQPYLLMAQPASIDELLSLPVVAEPTIETKLVSEDNSSVRMLSAKLDSIQDAITSKRTSVHFADDQTRRSRSLSPGGAIRDNRYNGNPSTPPARRTVDNRPSRPIQPNYRGRPSFRPVSRDRVKFQARETRANDAGYQRSRNDRRPPPRQNLCGRCSYFHNGRTCPAVSQRCNFCNNIGHFSSVCRKRMFNNASR